MKKSIIYALILFVQPLVSQQPDQKINQLSVQGSVELKQTADQASLSFTVKGVGPSLREAVEQADRNTKAVTDKLISLGWIVLDSCNPCSLRSVNHKSRIYPKSSSP
jgi:uncharacterized protein YggE